MEISYRQMLNCIPAMQDISNRKFGNVVGAYRVIRNIEKINEELATFQDFSNTIFDEHTAGEEPKVVPEEKMPEYTQKMETLLEEVVEVDVLELDLGLLDGVEISPAELNAMSFMIVELQEEQNGKLEEEVSEPQPDSGDTGDKG